MKSVHTESEWWSKEWWTQPVFSVLSLLIGLVIRTRCWESGFLNSFPKEIKIKINRQQARDKKDITLSRRKRKTRTATISSENVILVLKSVTGRLPVTAHGSAKDLLWLQMYLFTDSGQQRSLVIPWSASDSSLVKKQQRSIWNGSDTFSQCDDWWWTISLPYPSPWCCHLLWFSVLTFCHSDRRGGADSGGRDK